MPKDVRYQGWQVGGARGKQASGEKANHPRRHADHPRRHADHRHADHRHADHPRPDVFWLTFAAVLVMGRPQNRGDGVAVPCSFRGLQASGRVLFHVLVCPSGLAHDAVQQCVLQDCNSFAFSACHRLPACWPNWTSRGPFCFSIWHSPLFWPIIHYLADVFDIHHFIKNSFYHCLIMKYCTTAILDFKNTLASQNRYDYALRKRQF